MATRTISNGGGNYNAVGTWVEAAVPTSADTVFATSTSGPLTVNVASQAGVLNLTAYTNTITMSNTLGVYGNVTLGSGMTIAGTGTLSIVLGGTLKSNGKSWDSPLNFGLVGNSTVTLADDWTGTSRVSNGTLTGVKAAINGNNIFCTQTLGLATSGVISGTTKFIMAGTGTISGGTSGSYIQNDIDINTNGTITFGPSLVYNNGTFTYVTGDTITTGCQLDLAAGTTTRLQTSGMTWGNVINTNTTTVTLLSDLKMNGSLINSINGMTLNATGSSIYIGSGITSSSSIAGTAQIILTGSGIWEGTAVIANPLNINTSGTIQVRGSVAYRNRTLSYSAGTVVTTGSTLTTANAVGTTTLHTDGIVWNNIVMGGASNVVILTSHLRCLNFTSTSVTINTSNGSNFYISGNFTNSSASGSILGTAKIVLNGTGTWSNTSTQSTLNSLDISTSGTITLGASVRYNTGTLTYISGTVITAGSTLTTAASTTWACSGINWYIFVVNGGTHTLNQDLNIIGAFSSSNPNTYNGSNINLFGNLIINQATSGTADFIFKGTGTWNGSGLIGNVFTIDSSTGGTLTCSGTIAASNLYYSTGNVNTAGSTLSCSNSNAIWDTDGIIWNNLSIGAGVITLNSKLTATGTASIAAANTASFAGNNGFTIGSFTCSAAGRIINFTTGNTYTVTNSMVTVGTLASKITLQSSTVNTKAKFNLAAGASQDNGYLSGTDIDSSGGRSIFTYKGVLTRTINWNTMSTNPQTSISNFNNKLLTSIINIDADAQSFITTAGLTDKSQMNAVNQLVRRLKAQNLWTKLNAIYPFVGGTSTAHSYNLKNISQFQITWVGTVTHNSNGITPNGSNGYGNTGYNPSLQGVANNESIGIYSRTSAGVGAAGTALDMGASAGGGRVILSIRAATGTVNYGTLQLNDSTTSLIQTTTNLDGSGLFIGSRTSSTSLTKSRNGIITDTSIIANALSPVNLNVYIGCRNNSGTAAGFTSRNYAFAFLGKGLDSTDIANLYDIIQQYQIILGRKV